jgi:Uma2 family endonuclease
MPKLLRRKPRAAARRLNGGAGIGYADTAMNAPIPKQAFQRTKAGPHRFTVADMYRMVEAGIIPDGRGIELIDGELIDMASTGPEHSGTALWLAHKLTFLLGQRALVSTNGPLVLADDTYVEPDVQVLRPRDDFYRRASPMPGDVPLVVEISKTTRRKDRERKLPLYAKAGVLEVWLIDLTKQSIDVCRGPRGEAYTEIQDLRAGDTVSPAAFPDIRLAVADLLG